MNDTRSSIQPSAFVIAAPRSGSGKTTLSLGLMRALSRRGMSVQPYKCGPDYIDTQFHRVASGNDSINLDTFMSSHAHVVSQFDRHICGQDAGIVEGAMGMFDGYDRMKGSCAEIASLLGLPVVLLVDSTSSAYSVAATIYGFRNFRPDIKIAGVVFNRVASEAHFAFLRDACLDAGAECFGYIRRNTGLQTPSRHLGLSLTAMEEMDAFINASAGAVSENVDIDRLLEATRYRRADKSADCSDDYDLSASRMSLTIAVARDEAFNFIYPANIDALRSHRRYDVTVKWFSPLSDRTLPMADIVYLPGGYPELYARQLEANGSMRASIRDYVEAGGRLLGECGGMIYLGRDIDGAEMCDVLPLSVTMADARLTLGYRKVDMPGLTLRGHEFHYSRVTDDKDCQSIAVQSNAKGKNVPTPVYRHKNCIAGYTHLYWAEQDILKLWDL